MSSRHIEVEHRLVRGGVALVDLHCPFIEGHFGGEFKPAFDVWFAQVPAGEAPPGRPFDLEEYAPEAEALVDDLNAQADALVVEAREVNQTGDSFVLGAVIMASVLLFAGVGVKFKGRGARIMMLLIAAFVFVSGVLLTFSLPQNIASDRRISFWCPGIDRAPLARSTAPKPRSVPAAPSGGRRSQRRGRWRAFVRRQAVVRPASPE